MTFVKALTHAWHFFSGAQRKLDPSAVFLSPFIAMNFNVIGVLLQLGKPPTAFAEDNRPEHETSQDSHTSRSVSLSA